MAALLLSLCISAAWMASATQHNRRLALSSSTVFPANRPLSPDFDNPRRDVGGLQHLGSNAIHRNYKKVEEPVPSPKIAVHQSQAAYNQRSGNRGDLTRDAAVQRRLTSRHTATPTRASRSTSPEIPSIVNTPNSHVGPVVDMSEPSAHPTAALTAVLPVDESAADATLPQSLAPSAAVHTHNPTLSPLPLLESPLKVFILAGQSNAAGQGSIPHLDNLIRQQCQGGCNEFRNALWNETSKSYRVNHGVFEKYLSFNKGPLSVHDNLIPAASNDTEYQTFGTDVMLGWTLNEVLGEPIAIIKTAWGGKSLAVDFRPPSAGLGNYSGVDPSLYGLYYKKMVDEISLSLSEIHSWAPSYNDKQGYVLSGFVWFQGYNDLVHPDMCTEYGSNLASLIRDLRISLDVPELPVVVGELGMHGTDERYMPDFAISRIMKIRSSQFLVTKLDEFQGNTLFVSTSQYAVLDGDRYSGVYHYCGRADTFFYIGEAFGRGVLSLLGYENMTEANECKCDAVDSITHI